MEGEAAHLCGRAQAVPEAQLLMGAKASQLMRLSLSVGLSRKMIRSATPCPGLGERNGQRGQRARMAVRDTRCCLGSPDLRGKIGLCPLGISDLGHVA